MHIKLVILDGFKSYGTRVQVGEFDPHFNAITGYNGSGKSNILDGIAFVLGLSSLHHVRAQNLNDLIFKGGNVKRASVSVVFDNLNKAKSPVGQETFDEIIVSRTVEEGSLCKYYLNTVLVSRKEIQDMFESVGLNVNNPNFMIMQGKITKVVNMKPKEILNMIEETVGAASYQSKRDKSVRELGDKENTVDAIRETLTNIVQPALRRQQGAYHLYEQFKLLEKERDICADKNAVCVYSNKSELLIQVQSDMDEIVATDTAEALRTKELELSRVEKEKRLESIKMEVAKLAAEKLATVEKEVSLERKRVATLEAGLESCQAQTKACVVKLERAQKAHEAELQAVKAHNRKSGGALQEFENINKEIQTATLNLTTAQERESEVNAGRVIGEDGETFDLRERLVNVDKEIGKIRPKRDHEARALEGETRSLREKEVELSRTTSDQEIERKLEATEKEVRQLKQQMIRQNIVPEEVGSIDASLNEAANRLNVVERERRVLLKDYNWLDFSYSDPTPNFNRKLVHGCVFELFELIELDRYKVPFEVGCSGSFGIVIVETSEVAKNLIDHGNVATRRTYMPHTTLRPPQEASQLELDRKLGAGKAVTALSCIQYDPKYDKVMKYYMGRVVLCDTMATAKIVAFQMKYRAITMDGDVCDSDGTMQGGTRRNAGSTIVACQRLRMINKERTQLMSTVDNLKSKMNNYARNSALVKQFEAATRKLVNLSQEKECTAYAALLADVKELKQTVADRKARVEEWTKEMTVWQKQHDQLTLTLESLDQVKASNLKQAKAEVEKWTKALAAAQKKYNAKQEFFTKMDMDIKAKEAMIEEFLNDVKVAEKELEEAKAAEARKEVLLSEANVVYDGKKAEFEEVFEERRVWDEETSVIEAEIKEIVRTIDKLEVGKIKRDNVHKTKQSELKEITKILNHLKHNYQHMDLEGKFEENKLLYPELDMKKSQRRLDEVEAKLEELRTKVDPETAEKLQETKEQEKNACRRIDQIAENKTLLEGAIEVLDGQKSKLVATAFHAVNAEFGKMMSTLLPESTAKLVPVTSEDCLEDGLNIHVQLGGVWKESLTELSGGQRSLVALALVLSLCMYLPAPFYVLDEIDAALDMSHTQNIGVLIQQRFTDTQFICVSLKDGMYTNANVLFTTQFNNGKSDVLRTSRFQEKGGPRNMDKYQHVGNKKTRGGGRR